jgi:hypothetical protein
MIPASWFYEKISSFFQTLSRCEHRVGVSYLPSSKRTLSESSSAPAPHLAHLKHADLTNGLIAPTRVTVARTLTSRPMHADRSCLFLRVGCISCVFSWHGGPVFRALLLMTRGPSRARRVRGRCASAAPALLCDPASRRREAPGRLRPDDKGRLVRKAPLGKTHTPLPAGQRGGFECRFLKMRSFQSG